MIEAMADWARRLILLVLFAGFLELLLPSGELRKYIRVVIGLMVMLAVLQPVTDALRSPWRGAELPALAAGANAERAEALREAAYRKALARRIEATAGSIDGVAAVRAELEIKDSTDGKPYGEIVRVALAVKPAERREQGIRVEIGKSEAAAELKPETANKILQAVSEFFAVPPARIAIRSWQ